MLPYRILLKPWVFSALLFLAIFCYLYVDKTVILFFQDYLSHNFHIFDYTFNHVAKGNLVLPIVGLAIIFFKFVKPNLTRVYRLSYLFYILLIEHLFLSLLKFSCGRARPYLYVKNHISGFHPFTFSNDYFSFPSGHTMVIMAIAGFLALLVKSPWRFVILGMGLLVSFSRVWQNLHHLSDWFFSAYLSLLFFPLATWLLYRFLPKKHCQALNVAMGFSKKGI